MAEPGSDATFSAASGLESAPASSTETGAASAADPSRPVASGARDDNGGGAGAGKRPPRRGHGRWFIEAGVVVVVALLVAVLLRLFVVQVFYVPSTSMQPTLKPGDRIVVDKLSFDLHSIATGDIIVFKRPPREAGRCGGPPVPDLVKRVIGLPGQRISSRGNTVLINGKVLPEPWLPKDTPLGPQIPPTLVPANSYYVLGDNRADSCDSRYWGPVKRSLIVGEVVAIMWPPSQLHWF